MSGGSWDYVHRRFEEAADRLKDSKCPLRRVLGNRIELIAPAMHAIEWVDSFDYSPGDEIEPIKAALGKGWQAEVLKEMVEEAEAVCSRLEAMIKEAHEKD